MITQELLNTFRDKYQNDKQAQTISAAMAKTELKDLAFVPGNAAKLRGSFEIELKTRGITAQKQSGRCWLFSCMNIMRELVSEACGLEEFELSGNYLAFYDKLEKANNFLEMVIKHADEKGYFVCSEKYFRDFVYEVVVQKKHLNEAQLAMLAQEPETVEPWETH